MSRTLERSLLALIVLVYLGIATLYAVNTPAWQIPDEPAHYNYIRQVAQTGAIPVMSPGDWDNAYLDSIKAAKFSPASLGNRLDSIRYEDHQPPLYYLIAAPIYAISNGNLIALRLFSAVLGAGVVIVAWAVVRTTFPPPNAVQPWLALATTAFVAFLPQHVAMMAGVDNDSLAELLVALALLSCAAILNSQRKPSPLVLGFLCAAIAVTKITAYPAVAVIGLALLLHAYRESWTVGHMLRVLMLIAAPVIIIGGIWALHNMAVYGGPDFLAQAVHDRVVVGQPTTQDYLAVHGVSGWLHDFAQTSFDSFWGQFGWMGVPMTGSIYAGLAAFSLVVISGAVLAFVRWRRSLTPTQRDTLIVFAVAALLSFAGLVYWNLKYVQFQGRYLYPALIPMALFVAIGLAGWIALLRDRRAQVLTVGITALFAVFDVYVLYRIILPALR